MLQVLDFMLHKEPDLNRCNKLVQRVTQVLSTGPVPKEIVLTVNIGLLKPHLASTAAKIDHLPILDQVQPTLRGVLLPAPHRQVALLQGG